MKGTATFVIDSETYMLQGDLTYLMAGRIREQAPELIEGTAEPIVISLEVSPESVRRFWERWEKSLWRAVPKPEPIRERPRRAQWKHEQNQYGPRRR